MRYARRGNASADYHAVDSRPFESAFLLKRYDWSSSHCLRRKRIGRRTGPSWSLSLRVTKLPPAGRGKPTVENGTALRPRDKLLAGHAVDLRRWRVLWLPRNTSSIIAKDKPKHADFDAYELSSGRQVRDD